MTPHILRWLTEKGFTITEAQVKAAF